MNQQSSNNQETLRRQISFLKSFDQKLEGLKRESERLQKLLVNSKLRFSRSSLGGLYRIVNGLKSAGSVFGFDDIEAWAKNTDSWLTKHSKKSAKPTKQDIDWLNKAIKELEELRDAALMRLEDEQLYESLNSNTQDEERVEEGPENEKGDNEEEDEESVGEPGDDSDDDSDDDEYESADDLEEVIDDEELDDDAVSEVKTSPGLPFDDVPQARTLNQSKFAEEKKGRSKKKRRKRSKKKKKHGRDRTSTIPLVAEDLNSIVPDEEVRDRSSTMPLGIEDLEALVTEESKPKPPPLKHAIEKRKVQKSAKLWKSVAIIAILGLAVMIFISLNDNAIGRGESGQQVATIADTPNEASHPRAEAEKNETPAKEEEKPVEKEPAAQEEAKPSDDDAASKQADSAKPEPAEKKAEEKKKPAAENKKLARAEKPKANRKTVNKGEQTNGSPKKKAEKKAKKKTAAAPEESGTLVVKAAAGGAVLVLVDGTSRGKAPVRVKLKPGLHEVVFSANGKRAMRMVPIRADKTKTIEAKVP